jgi:hypothetical protein
MTARKPAHMEAVTAPSLLLHSGDTAVTITYRSAGHEGVVLQSLTHGVQQLAGFNPAAGDFIRLDNILDPTLAHADLSDIADYITATSVDGGTMLSADPTGHGLAGTPFAFLQGVSITVAQLVADGGLAYVPTAISVTPAFDTPLTLRPDGLETVLLGHMVNGIGPQILHGFNPAEGDRLQLASVLNATLAQASLSDIAHYITVTHAGGNTTLSVDRTGTGQAGTPFAVLDGVTLSLTQLLADGALLYTPSKVIDDVTKNITFQFRAAGLETADLTAASSHVAAAQLAGFSLAGGDVLDVGMIMSHAGVTNSVANIQADFTTVQQGNATELWFNASGAGGGTLEAVLQNTSVTVGALLAAGAINANSDTGAASDSAPGFLMRMGCPDELITYRASGNMGVCLAAPDHGVQQLAHFNPAAGDIIGVDDILEQTLAHDDLSDVANYITSQVINGGTMLYADLTGQGLQGTPIAFLQGVQTSVAQLVAEGAMLYVPDQVAIAPTYDTPFTLRSGGLETVLLNPAAPGIPTQQINGFALNAGDTLELAKILSGTQASPTLSNIANYITVTESGGNTTLALDPTGHGGAGTPFAVLEGVTATLSQLLVANALVYDPANIAVAAAPGASFACRAAGEETVLLQNVTGGTPTQLTGFSLAADDGINVAAILKSADVLADISNIDNYFSTVQTGGNTQLWFDPTGSGSGGTLEAVLQNTSVTITSLLAHSALHLT